MAQINNTNVPSALPASEARVLSGRNPMALPLMAAGVNIFSQHSIAEATTGESKSIVRTSWRRFENVDRPLREPQKVTVEDFPRSNFDTDISQLLKVIVPSDLSRLFEALQKSFLVRRKKWI
jgi:hypothetical protein